MVTLFPNSAGALDSAVVLGWHTPALSRPPRVYFAPTHKQITPTTSTRVEARSYGVYSLQLDAVYNDKGARVYTSESRYIVGGQNK